jgi:hypothetical protein
MMDDKISFTAAVMTRGLLIIMCSRIGVFWKMLDSAAHALIRQFLLNLTGDLIP